MRFDARKIIDACSSLAVITFIAWRSGFDPAVTLGAAAAWAIYAAAFVFRK